MSFLASSCLQRFVRGFPVVGVGVFAAAGCTGVISELPDAGAEAPLYSAAFDAGTTAFRKRLTDTIEPLRVSGWDERPYKTLTVASGAAEPTGRSVFVISHVDVTPDPKIARQRSSPTKVVRIFPPAPRGNREILSGPVDQQIEQVAKKLKEQSLI